MKKQLKPIPKFKNEEEEANFWDTHDTTDYFDWSKALKGPLFPSLRKCLPNVIPGLFFLQNWAWES